MSKMINFIRYGDYYLKVMDNIIDPIIKYLPKDAYQITTKFQSECLNVSFFAEHIPHRDVFLCHGIADKNYHNGDRIKDYDYIFASGDTWKQKLIKQGVPENKIYVTGWTKIEPMFNNLTKILKDENDNKIRVLYAPTHNMLQDKKAVTVSSYPRLDEYFSNTPSDIEILHSVHPANKAHRDTTLDLLGWNDVLISDCSSVLYEALSLNIPVVLPDWLVKQPILQGYPNSFEYQIYDKGIGYHAQNINHMWELIREASQKGLSQQTKDFIEGIFPARLRGNSGKVTADILLKLRDA
jgi:hypothetical protein